MKSNIVSRFITPPPNTTIRKLRGYGDKVMIEYFGLTTELTGPNFNHVDFYSPYGNWGAVTKFCKLCDGQGAEYQWMKSLLSPPTLAAENWLIGEKDNPPERPNWWKGGTLVYGTSAVGLNLVLIETKNGVPVEYEYMDRYPAEPSTIPAHPIQFYRVIGMPKSYLGRITHYTHPYWVHRWNQANSIPAPNTIDWYPKNGNIYQPVWSFGDYPNNSDYPNLQLIAKACFY